MDNKTHIAKLEWQLKESNDCLKSIMYCPEQVKNFTDDGFYRPIWLVSQIAENEKVLGENSDKES
jgi:Pyruvate/2-oxoacid:ferredoxin oxidoreductase delta subunit